MENSHNNNTSVCKTKDVDKILEENVIKTSNLITESINKIYSVF